jgi:hypothetical protein
LGENFGHFFVKNYLTKGAAVCYNGISAPAQTLAPRTNNSRLKIIGYHSDNIGGH